MIKYLVISLLFVSCNGIINIRPTHEDTVEIWRKSFNKCIDSFQTRSSRYKNCSFNYINLWSNALIASSSPSKRDFNKKKKLADSCYKECTNLYNDEMIYSDSVEYYFSLMYSKK